MNKKSFDQQVLRIIFISLCLFIFSNTFAQTPPRKPYMWAPKEEGLAQIEYFKRLKLKQMSKNAGLPTSLLNDKFFLGNFWGMMRYFESTYHNDYLHVYLGINTQKKVVLIFAPAESESQSSDLKYYYFPKNFDPVHPADFQLTIDDKNLWISNFEKSMALNTIGTSHPDNQYTDASGRIKSSDTKFVTYCFADILELMLVKDYFVSKGFDINNSLNGYLGSYSLNGVPSGRDRGRYINRIVVQFDLLNGNNSEFFLDTIPEFMMLPNAEVSNCMKAVDKGQLCPTNCP